MKQKLESKWEKWTGLTEYKKGYPIQRKRHKLFVNFLKSIPKEMSKEMKVLDVGCRSGDVANEVSKLGFDAYGIDVAIENVKDAKAKNPHCTFKVADLNAGKIPFPDNYFDVVWAGDVIEHVYNTINMFSEFNRILKKNGHLVCSTPYHGMIKMMAISLVDLKTHFHPEHPHVRFYTDKSLRKTLKKYQFKVKTEKYLGRIRLLSNNMFFISKKIKDLDWDKVPGIFH